MSREIHLITQFYRVTNGDEEYQKKRQYEIIECLKRNCCLESIHRIHLLLEEDFVEDDEVRGLLHHPKVNLFLLGKRMTYADVFLYYNTYLLGKICILANADIYFTESLTTLQHINFKETVIALTRYELLCDYRDANGEEECILYGQECNLVKNNPWLQKGEIAVFSQDTWIWCQNEPLCVPECDFFLGVTGCDNMIVRRFLQASFHVINPCNFVASIHYDFLSTLSENESNSTSSTGEYLEKGQVSSKRTMPIGNFKDYVFLHPSLSLPEKDDPMNKCLVKTSYIPQDCEEHDFRKQIYSTIYSSTLESLYVNSCQLDLSLKSVSRPERLALTESELLLGIGSIDIPKGCTSFWISIHHAKLILQRDIDIISKASSVSIDISSKELRPYCDEEWKEWKTVKIPICYKSCRNLIFRLFDFSVPCRSIRFRFEGTQLSESKLNLLLKTDSTKSIPLWVAQNSIDLLLNLSLHLDYMPVIESFDNFTCLEILNGYFRNKEPKSIENLFKQQKQNRMFFKTIPNMEKFYCSYVNMKKTLLSQSITGTQRQNGNCILITIMNRTKNLLAYFDTWVQQNLLDGIIIVDWSTYDGNQSTIESFLSNYSYYPPTLKSVILVRIDGEKDFYRTVAQNLGASFCNFNKILKLDSDISLKKDFFVAHPLLENEFYVGDWKLARDENEKYTHGNIYLNTRDFFNINGYDERIRSYGWDDSDFTQRLELSGLKKKFLNIDYTYHNPHSNFNRICNLRDSEISLIEEEHPEILTQTNRILLLKMPRWCHVNPRHSFSLLDSSTSGCGYPSPFQKYTLSRNTLLKDFEFDKEEYKEAFEQAKALVHSWYQNTSF